MTWEFMGIKKKLQRNDPCAEWKPASFARNLRPRWDDGLGGAPDNETQEDESVAPPHTGAPAGIAFTRGGFPRCAASGRRGTA